MGEENIPFGKSLLGHASRHRPEHVGINVKGTDFRLRESVREVTGHEAGAAAGIENPRPGREIKLEAAEEIFNPALETGEREERVVGAGNLTVGKLW